MNGASPMRTLDTLRLGERGVIGNVRGDDAVAVRLMEMGVVEGEAIEFLGSAPLGDPLEFLVCGYRLSLRVAEARRVELTTVAEVDSERRGR